MMTFHKVLNISLNPNNAGKKMWLRAQTANLKLKQNGQIQDGVGMQVFFGCVGHS